jgi:hypothetical protein
MFVIFVNRFETKYSFQICFKTYFENLLNLSFFSSFLFAEIWW